MDRMYQGLQGEFLNLKKPFYSLALPDIDLLMCVTDFNELFQKNSVSFPVGDSGNSRGIESHNSEIPGGS